MRFSPHVGDFRLLDRMCIEVLKPLRKSERNTNGSTAWIGFKKASVAFETANRVAFNFSRWALSANILEESFTNRNTVPFMLLETIKANKRLGGALLFFIILIAAIFALNWLTPENADDYPYAYIFNGTYFDTSRPITSIPDILSSQLAHYFGMNGRFVNHFFVQLFSGIFGKHVFCFVNTLAFGAFLWALLAYCRTTRETFLFNLSFLSACILFLMPVFAETFLWMTGGMNYLWPALMVTVFLVIIRREQEKKGVRPATFLFAIFAFVAGWTHEALTFPLSLSLAFVCWVERRKVSRGFLLMVGLFALGSLLCTFSPATLNRVAESGTSAKAIFIKLLNFSSLMLQQKLLWALVIVVLLEKWLNKNWSFRCWAKANWLIILCIILSVGIVFASGMIYLRATFALAYFSLLLLATTVTSASIALALRNKLGACCAVAVILLLCFITPYSLKNAAEYKHLLAQIRTHKCIIATNEVRVPTPLADYLIKPVPSDETMREFFVLHKDTVHRDYRAAMYKKDSLVYLPSGLLQRIVKDKNAFTQYENDAQLPYYVLQTNRPSVKKVTYIMRAATANDIPFFLRPIANKLTRYTQRQSEVAKERYRTLQIDGRYYLFVARNRNFDNRIINIKVE